MMDEKPVAQSRSQVKRLTTQTGVEHVAQQDADTGGRCSHGEIATYPSSDARYPGYATCRICRERMETNLDAKRALEARLAEAEAARREAEEATAHIDAARVQVETQMENLHAHYRGDASCPDKANACWGCTLREAEQERDRLQEDIKLLTNELRESELETGRQNARAATAEAKAALADRYRRINSLFETKDIDDDYDALTPAPEGGTA